MKFYIDKSGVIRWSPVGWPEEPKRNCDDNACDHPYAVNGTCECHNYEQALSRAKAESVLVAGQMEIKSLIRRAHKIDLGKTVPPGLYDVPDSEINKEWL